MDKIRTLDLKSSRKFTSLHKEEKGSLPPLELSKFQKEKYDDEH